MSKHSCARCGRKLTADKMIFSRFTRARYCRDLNSCAARAKRSKSSPRSMEAVA